MIPYAGAVSSPRANIESKCCWVLVQAVEGVAISGGNVLLIRRRPEIHVDDDDAGVARSAEAAMRAHQQILMPTTSMFSFQQTSDEADQERSPIHEKHEEDDQRNRHRYPSIDADDNCSTPSTSSAMTTPSSSQRHSGVSSTNQATAQYQTQYQHRSHGRDSIATTVSYGCSLRYIEQRQLKKRRRSASTPARHYVKTRYNCDALIDTNTLVAGALHKAHTWTFNVFEFDLLTHKHPVVELGMYIAAKYNWYLHLRLDYTKLLHFYRLVEVNYRAKNHYHCSTHAADVAQAMFAFMAERGMHWMSAEERMCCILAAFAHDLRHPGLNQTFLTKTKHHLRQFYQDQSVLEHFHWDCTRSILLETGLFDHFDSAAWTRVCELMKAIILATDMQRQDIFLADMNALLNSNEPERSILVEPKTNKRKVFIMQMMIKCADISNPCRPWRLSQDWSYRASAEFFAQGDQERRLGLPVTPTCDRYSTSIPKIQTGFMQYLARPLFEAWHTYAHSTLSKLMLSHLERNQQRWQELLQTELDVGSLSVDTSSKVDSRGSVAADQPTNVHLHVMVPSMKRRVSAPFPPRGQHSPGKRLTPRRRISLPAKMGGSYTHWNVQVGVSEPVTAEVITGPNTANHDDQGCIRLSIEQPTRISWLPPSIKETPETGRSSDDRQVPDRCRLMISSSSSSESSDDEYCRPKGWNRKQERRRHSEPVVVAPLHLCQSGLHLCQARPLVETRRASLPISGDQLQQLFRAHRRSASNSCKTRGARPDSGKEILPIS